jgi:hypothetical protein
MKKKCQRLAVLLLFAVGVLVGVPTPVNAAATQIAGVSSYDTAGDVCGPPPPGYADYTSLAPLVMRGSLEGCWYTKVEASKQTTSGVYLETGEEVFVGTLNGGPAGTFATTYKFESKWDPNVSTGTEIVGRCNHSIVTGTGGFNGASGWVFFKDDAPEYFYRGHISLG